MLKLPFRYTPIASRPPIEELGPEPPPADEEDAEWRAFFDREFDEYEALVVEYLCGILPVEAVIVSAHPAWQPTAWGVEHVIRGADNPDVLARPPVVRFNIMCPDRETEFINLAQVDVLVLELDVLAADRQVPWQIKRTQTEDGGAAFVMVPEIGVSGTDRDLFVVELTVGPQLADVVWARPERSLGILYRMLDFADAHYSIKAPLRRT